MPVVLCVWQRLDRLATTIGLLERQRGATIELHIWNNNRAARSAVESIAKQSAGLCVHVTHSSRNVGGFGRFYLARELAPRHPCVVFVDDDLTFSPTMVADFVDEWVPGSIVSHWAYRFLSGTDFWSREPLSPGESADYCGTGGMIADTRIFAAEALFRCRRRYWFVEDLWLSYYASSILGWRLTKSRVPFEMHHDGRDQFLYLLRRKSEFLRHLVAEGWAVPRLRDDHVEMLVEGRS